MQIGSKAHKELFCQNFLANHLAYDPESLPWPELKTAELELLQAVPFWQEAWRVEQSAGMMVGEHANIVQDPLIKEAIALQAQEEARHAKIIQFLLKNYKLQVTEPDKIELPDKIEPAFLTFGCKECVDAFFAFGLFAIARLSAILPEAIFTIFDQVLDEEANHIVFFINWVAYERIQQGKGAKIWQIIEAGKYYSLALQELLKTITKTNNNSQVNFTATGASTFTSDLTPKIFLHTCLVENSRRLSKFDPRLLKPQFLPTIAQLALKIL